MTPASHTSVAQAITQALREAMTLSQQRCFALVDGAQLLDLPERVQRQWPATNAISLLTGAIGNGASEVGPLLFELSSEQMKSGLPSSLLDVVSARSVGSFLISTTSVSALAGHLSSYVDVTLDDHSAMVMRFFDPRVLPFWLDLVQPRYAPHLGAVVSSWFYWDQALAVRKVSFPSQMTGKDTEFPVRISSNDEQTLLDRCYPFTLIERFRVEDEAALAKIPAHQRYDFFRDQVARANGHGIRSNGEIEAYCSLAIASGPRFDEDADVKIALAKLKEGMPLLKALELVDGEVWIRMRGSR